MNVNTTNNISNYSIYIDHLQRTIYLQTCLIHWNFIRNLFIWWEEVKRRRNLRPPPPKKKPQITKQINKKKKTLNKRTCKCEKKTHFCNLKRAKYSHIYFILSLQLSFWPFQNIINLKEWNLFLKHWEIYNFAFLITFCSFLPTTPPLSPTRFRRLWNDNYTKEEWLFLYFVFLSTLLHKYFIWQINKYNYILQKWA